MSDEKTTQVARGGARAGAGRPAWEPSDKDRAIIRQLSGVGVPQKMIATIIGVSWDALNAHCKPEMDLGKAVAVANVTKTLYQLATVEKQAWAIRLFLMTQAGWKEQMEVDHNHSGSIDVNHNEVMLDDDRAELDALRRRKAAALGIEDYSGRDAERATGMVGDVPDQPPRVVN